MSSLVLCRHGNTFEAGQTPVWVGARTDLPLTDEGLAQAARVAEVWRSARFSSLIAGPLRRTREFADVLGQVFDVEPVVDDRLCEIDYGAWEGLSNDAIRERFDGAALEAWDKRGLWPDEAGWAPSFPTLMARLRSFLDMCKEQLHKDPGAHICAVTSNGILRLIYADIVGPGADLSQAKVATGAYCCLAPTDEGWAVQFWNKRAELS